MHSSPPFLSCLPLSVRGAPDPLSFLSFPPSPISPVKNPSSPSLLSMKRGPHCRDPLSLSLSSVSASRPQPLLSRLVPERRQCCWRRGDGGRKMAGGGERISRSDDSVLSRGSCLDQSAERSLFFFLVFAA